MQATLGQQERLPQTGHAISRPTTIESTSSAHAARFGLVAVWRGAWQALVSRALPMLSFALMGLVGTSLIGTSGFTLSQPGLMIAQAIAGTLVLSFARGGISWLALHAQDATASFTAACRSAFARLPALVVGSLLYAAVITTGAVGLGLALRYIRIHVPLSFRGTQRYTLDLRTYEFATKAAKSFVAQGASTLIPDPGAPFGAWLPALRASVLLRIVKIEVDPHGTTLPASDVDRFVPIYSPAQREFWWITAASAALLLIAEVVLRLRTAFVMRADRSYSFAPLGRSLWFSVKRFGLIAAHVWLLRLVIFAFSLLFVIVPVVLVQELVLPKLILAVPWTWEWLYAHAFIRQATAAGVALVGIVFTVFSIAYDARLYLLLATRADTVAACHLSPSARSPKVSPIPSAPSLPRRAQPGFNNYPI